ncbi:tail fiber assembly protein [Erwinia aphidicola]|uniref:Tail fiber assembly protein n=1 Tax=Erwinia aphidicola TaxID=68334 RepID=A0ABU8DF19_ERWAP
MHYSAKNNAFYEDTMKDDYIQAGSWPDDLVEISDEAYNALFAGQSDGKVITPGNDGRPVLTDPAPPTDEELIAQANSRIKSLMAYATAAIGPLQDAEDLGIQTDDEAELLKAWKKYRVQLNRVDTSRAGAIDWPEAPGDAA